MDSNRQYALHHRYAPSADARRGNLTIALLSEPVEQAGATHFDALAGFEVETAIGSRIELSQ